MAGKQSITRAWIYGFAWMVLTGLPSVAVRAENYYPDHPVVRTLVERGIGYLSKTTVKGQSTFPDVGIEMLIGYTIYKVEGDPDHPAVVRGVAAAKNYIDSITAARGNFDSKAVYHIAMASMTLATVDVDGYSQQLIKARDFILRIQQTTGGFGYIDGSHKDTSGDISQTQYILLSLWTMSQLGIEVPEDRVVRTLAYLAEAQIKNASAPSFGGWPYQFEPGGSHPETTTNSLTAAGLSSVLIAGDILGVYRNRLAEADEEDGLIPPAFKRVLAEADKPKRGGNIDRSKLDALVNSGLVYNQKNPYNRTSWHYYYLYSLERFESFLEIAARKQNKSPAWYNSEVDRLKTAQAGDGSWGGEGADADAILGPQVSTCFAVLFLIRSTQKAIGEMKEAVAVGWPELPSDLSTVTMVNGKPVSKNEATNIEDALKMLEDDKKAQGEDRLVAEKIVFSSDPARKKDELNRFSRLLRSKDWKARRIAAKVLGRSDDLDVTPDLIFALTDRDNVVSRNAETSLRLISRQLDKYHLPKEGAISEQDRVKAQREWKRWFLELRPDFIFVE
ncbi:MAG: hypothetical protein ACK5OB_01750 [Pirellula sp.]